MSSFPQSFDPIRSYDRPDVFLTQLFQGEASFDSLRRTFLQPQELTPSERDTFMEDIKEAFGNNEVTNTMVDIATNPFVILSFLVTPPAGKALKRAGRLFTGGDYSRFLGENSIAFQTLHALRLTSASNQLQGTPGNAVLREMGDTLNGHYEVERAIISKPTQDVLDRIEKKTGVRLDTLDPDQISDPTAKKIAKEINHAMYIRMAGWDKTGLERKVVDVTPFLKGDEPIEAYTGSLTTTKLKDPIKVTDEMTTFEAMDVAIQNETGGPVRVSLSEKGDRVKVGRNSTKKLYADSKKIDEGFANIKRRLADGEIDESQVKKEVSALYGYKKGTGTGESINLPDDHPVFSLSREDRVYLPRNKELGVSDGKTIGFYKFKEGVTKLDEVEVVVNTPTQDGMFSELGQQRAVQEVIDRYELDDYIEAHKKFREERLVNLFGNDSVYSETGEFVADTSKIERLTAAIVAKERNQFSQGTQELVDDVASSLLDDEVLNAIRSGDELNQEFKTKIQKTLVEAVEKGLVTDTYVSRNLIKSVDRAGNVIPAPSIYRDKNNATGHYLGAEAQQRKNPTVQWRPEDLEEMEELFGGSEALTTQINKSYAERAKGLLTKDRHGEYGINFHDTQRRYAQSSAITHTMHIQKPGERVEAALRDSLTERVRKKKNEGKGFATLRPGYSGERATLEDVLNQYDPALADKLPVGGVSLLDMLEGTVQSIDDTRTQEFILDSVLPTLTGRKGVNDVVSEAVFKNTQRFINYTATGAAGRIIAGTGEPGKRLVEQMKNWSEKAEQNIRSGEFGGISGRGAQALYASHLGLNLGSVMLNMLQPITMGMPLVGVGAAMRGYRDSMKMMSGYVAERMKMGARITDAQKADLLEKHFTETIELADGTTRRVNFADLADIGLDPFRMVDEASLRSGYKRPKGAAEYWLFEGTMKPFEKAEWFNRVTMAHAAKHVRRRAGKLNTSEDVARLRDDAAELVQKTQFGSDPINRPEIFYSKYFENPLARQFLQFPLRQITGTLLNPQEMGGSAMKHIIKAMGYSAIAYEVGKNALDMDISRGLFAGSLTDLVGGDRFFTERDPTGSFVANIAPPALDILVSGAQAVGTADFELLKETLPRVIPGGVAFSRLVGAVGQVPMAAGLQRQYADWSNMQGNQVPVYKSDGRLIGNMDASSVVLKALGADMRQYKEPQELNKFLLANREQMKEYRRKWISSVLGNNLGEAERIKAEFEGRFKMPLTVSKAQMKNAVKLREQSVVSRVGDTMEKASRTTYQSEIPQNYFERVDSPQVEAETARYIWSTMQGQNPGNPGMTTERQ